MLSYGLANGGGWRKVLGCCDVCFQWPPRGDGKCHPQQIGVKWLEAALVVKTVFGVCGGWGKRR